MTRRASFVLVLMLFFVSNGYAAGEEEKTPLVLAYERVAAFEETLMPSVMRKDGKRGELSEAERASIKDFFAKLDSSEMKIAALNLLTDRFVYVVPQDMRIPLAQPLLDDTDPAVQAEALQAIAEHARDQAILPEKVLELSTSKDAGVRLAAVLTMGFGGHREYAVALNRMIDDPDAKVRAQAIKSWEWWVEVNRQNTLLPLISDPDREVASNALRALYDTMRPPHERYLGRENLKQANVAVISKIHHQYKNLSPEQKAEFKLALELAVVPDWFSDAVLKD